MMSETRDMAAFTSFACFRSRPTALRSPPAVPPVDPLQAPAPEDRRACPPNPCQAPRARLPSARSSDFDPQPRLDRRQPFLQWIRFRPRLRRIDARVRPILAKRLALGFRLHDLLTSIHVVRQVGINFRSGHGFLSGTGKSGAPRARPIRKNRFPTECE